MATNPWEIEERITTGGLAAWLVRNADPGSDPNAGNGHRLPLDRPIGAEAPPDLEDIKGELVERLGRWAVLALFALTTAMAGVFLFLGIASEPVILPPQAEEATATQPAPVRPEPPAPPHPIEALPPVSPPRPAEPAAPTPERPIETAGLSLTPDEIHALLSRGEALFNMGDVAAARPLLERAALAGDATAALKLGQSYDPGYLANAGLRLTAGNLGLAIFWYRRGQELGNGTAAFLARKLETAARAGWAPVSARPPAWRP